MAKKKADKIEESYLSKISSLTSKVRQIGDARDIFSGERAQIREDVKTWMKSRPYEEVEMSSTKYTYFPGESGVLYLVAFNVPFSLEEGVRKIYFSTIDQKMNLIRKAIGNSGKLNKIRRLLEEDKHFETTLVRELFELGSKNYRGYSGLRSDKLNSLASLSPKLGGSYTLFFTGEKNLRANVTLEEMMINSAIARELTEVYQALPKEYRDLVTPHLKERIEVISDRLRYK